MPKGPKKGLKGSKRAREHATSSAAASAASNSVSSSAHPVIAADRSSGAPAHAPWIPYFNLIAASECTGLKIFLSALSHCNQDFVEVMRDLLADLDRKPPNVKAIRGAVNQKWAWPNTFEWPTGRARYPLRIHFVRSVRFRVLVVLFAGHHDESNRRWTGYVNEEADDWIQDVEKELPLELRKAFYDAGYEQEFPLTKAELARS
jgi:hypothetical protein